MTDTRTYDVNGATLTVTLNLDVRELTVDLSINTEDLDRNEPVHSSHQLMGYLSPRLSGWETRQSFSWCKRYRRVTCRNGSQARRVTKAAITKVADAVSAALLDRDRRKAEMAVALAL